MGFVLQASDGSTVADANAYASVTQLRAHAADRGVDLTGKTDADVEKAIVAATDFMDAAYPYVGFQLYRDQGTQWPRGGLTTSFLRGLPPALVKSTCILAIKVLKGTVLDLLPTPSVDPSGLAVSEVSKSVGPISTTTKFAVPSGGASASAVRPVYPEVELLLRRAGLTGSQFGGRVSRG